MTSSQSSHATLRQLQCAASRAGRSGSADHAWWTRIELYRLGLETLHRILQRSGMPLRRLYSRCPVASTGPLFPTLFRNQLLAAGVPHHSGYITCRKGGIQDRFSMHDAYIRCSRCSFARVTPTPQTKRRKVTMSRCTARCGCTFCLRYY